MVELVMDIQDPQYELVALQFDKEQEAFRKMFSETQYDIIQDNYYEHLSDLNNKTSLDR